MIKYKVKDNQFEGNVYLHGGEIFTSLNDIEEALFLYHSQDCETINLLESLDLEGLLEYGDWTLEEITENIIKKSIKPTSYQKFIREYIKI